MNRLIYIITGAIIGAIFGGILGHSLFNPEALIWILMALVGFIAGGFVGGSSVFEILMAPLCGSAIGLGIGWFVATIIFGEHIGGIGTMISLGMAIIGWMIGKNSLFLESQAALAGLLGMLHAGFAISVIMMLLMLLTGGSHSTDFIAWFPLIILFSLLGALAGYWFEKKSS